MASDEVPRIFGSQACLPPVFKTVSLRASWSFKDFGELLGRKTEQNRQNPTAYRPPNTSNVDRPSTLSWFPLSILAPRPKKVQGAFTSLGQCWCTSLGVVELGRSHMGWLNRTLGRWPNGWWVWGSKASNVSQKECEWQHPHVTPGRG